MTAGSAGCLCKTPLFLGCFWVLSSPSFPDTRTAMEILPFPQQCLESLRKSRSTLAYQNLRILKQVRRVWKPSEHWSSHSSQQAQLLTLQVFSASGSEKLPRIQSRRAAEPCTTGWDFILLCYCSGKRGFSLVRPLCSSHCTARDPAGPQGIYLLLWLSSPTHSPCKK